MTHTFSKLGLISFVVLTAGCAATADSGQDETAEGAEALMKGGGGIGSSCTIQTCGGTMNPFGKCTATDPYGRCTQCEAGGAKAVCATAPNGALVCTQIYCTPTKY